MTEVLHTVEKRLDDFLWHVRRAYGGLEVEDVHQMRTASRRLRTALKLTACLYSKKNLKKARKAISRMARSLSELRDRDVELEILAERLKNKELFSEESFSLLKIFETRMKNERAIMAESILDNFSYNKVETVERSVCDLLKNEKTIRRAGTEEWRTHMRGVMESNLYMLEEGARLLRKKMNKNLYHVIRIEAKRVRYALELFEPLFGVDAEDLVKRVRTIQRQFGFTRDLDRLILRLRENRPETASKKIWKLTLEPFLKERQDSFELSLVMMEDFLDEGVVVSLLERVFPAPEIPIS